MSEKSIVEALSGSEIVEAIAHKVKEQLRRDCFLSANMAYHSFEAKIHIVIKMKDVGHNPEVDKVIDVRSKEPIPTSYKDPAEAALVHTEESDSEMGPDPANVVRVESDQPVPIQVTKSDGNTEIKRIKYAGKPPRTADNPNPAGGHTEAVRLPDADK